MAVNLVSDHEILVPEALKMFRNRNRKSLRRFRRRNLRLHSLRVSNGIEFYPEYGSDLDRWIGVALESGIEKLKLHHPLKDPVYCLPQPVYFAATLTTLKLVQCVLDQPLSLFRSIRKMTLKKCCIKSGPIKLSNLDCPDLESFELYFCSGFDSLSIKNLVRLGRVEVWLIDSILVEISSHPNLEKLTIGCGWLTLWKDVRINGCNGLKFLHLSSGEITDDGFHSLISKLPLLEELYVANCDYLKNMKVSCPKLKTLMVSIDVSYGLSSVDIAVPTLKNFIFLSNDWKSVEINPQGDCCDGLETLVLASYDMRDEEFHDIISKFPMLQSLWVYGCGNLKKIKIPNDQLRILNIARCSELKAVEVDSDKLVDMYCRGREDLEISVADADSLYATGKLRCERVAGCDGYFNSVSLLDMVARLVNDKIIVSMIDGACCGM